MREMKKSISSYILDKLNEINDSNMYIRQVPMEEVLARKKAFFDAHGDYCDEMRALEEPLVDVHA